MIGYKLFTLRKDGSIGPLFINKRQRLTIGVKYQAEAHPTKGFALRPGWHICSTQSAPHLSKQNRVWARVEFNDYQECIRPESQGGLWFIAKELTILELV